MIREQLVHIGDEPSLAGILTEPTRSDAVQGGLPVLLLNAGLLHDVGPSRLHVLLARSLAVQGNPVLRFDFAGVGDSELRFDGLPPAQSMVLQTQQTMDFLARTRGLERFVVGGICSGAVTALRVALQDERVVGLALLNPQGYFSTGSAAVGALVQDRVEKNYLFRVSLRRRESWLRLLRGDVDLRKLSRTVTGNLLRPLAPDRDGNDEIRTLAGGVDQLLLRGVRMLQLYADGDPGLVELAMLAKALPPARRADLNMQPILVRGVDHLFTPLHGQRAVLATMRHWLDGFDRARAPAGSLVGAAAPFGAVSNPRMAGGRS